MPSELDLRPGALPARWAIRPNLGIRVAPLGPVARGHWPESRRRHESVFGLNAAQVIDVVDRLRDAGLLDCLQDAPLPPGHPDPQHPRIREAATEAARIYVRPRPRRARPWACSTSAAAWRSTTTARTPISTRPATTGVDEYCADLVEDRHADLRRGGDRPPGHHHRVAAARSWPTTRCWSSTSSTSPASRPPKPNPPTPERRPPNPCSTCVDVRTTSLRENLQECFNDAVYYRDQHARPLFSTATSPCASAALAEQVFWHILTRISQEAPAAGHDPRGPAQASRRAS